MRRALGPSLCLGLATSACASGDGSDSAGDSAGQAARAYELAPYEDPVDPEAEHLLATALATVEAPVLHELTPDLQTAWSWAGNGAGAMGAWREEDGQTTYSRVGLPPAWTSSIEQIDAEGQVIWGLDDLFVAGIGFSHGVVRTPSGRYIALDTAAGELVAFDEDGTVAWTTPAGTPDEPVSPNGIALRVDPDDPEGPVHLAVSTLGRLDDSGTHGLVRFLLPDPDEPPEEVFRVLLAEQAGETTWPHGPRFQDDGTLTVCHSAAGQVVAFDEVGAEAWRMPEEPGSLFAFPRDAVFLSDGSLVVADAGQELIRVADPLGEPQVVAAVALPGVFSVGRVDCGEGGGVPCLSGGPLP